MPGFLTLGQLVNAASAFVVNLLASGVLQPSERGVLALMLQISYLVAVVVVLGVERPFMATVEASFGQSLSLFSRIVRPALWGMVIPFTFAVVLFVVGETYWGFAVTAMALYVMFNVQGKGIRVAAIASGTISYFLAYVFITQVLTVLCATAFAAMRVNDAVYWYLAYAFSGLAGVIILILYRVKVPASEEATRLVMTVRKQGLKLLPASFGNTAMLRSERLLLPALIGTASLGVYVTVATVMEMATWPVMQWVDSSLRRWRVASDSNAISARRIAQLYGIALGITSSTSVVLGVAAHIVVTHVLPAAYRPATELILPLAVGSVLFAIARVQQGLLLAASRPGRVSIIEITGLVCSVVAYLALIPSLGVLGAAVGSIVGYGVAVLMGVIEVLRWRRSHGR
ncbi:hypothetical protein GCM10011490_22700 [Pseudoclavibacter endophyticus]|uniref:Uncharacterized protein n=1 Tax=Pseudoclavibacter endophyticus TaxID=1778590 RepID=A0A6H9WKL3_9MICO|nr:polysaccharide biosynthesis C-terminal domain-containing protein [Pseudoclavibacter endophyticus]KAB1648299.1 hypothetical protein F8O04_11405 [Pseudoclavibacter endophyticus]GGA71468.1 hypothetical protein GCM10011490_22700 [Pseudoclavibacter endophyticus]